MKYFWIIAFALTLIFLTLKLAEIGMLVSWHWIWVFSPIWGSLAVYYGIHLLSLIGIAIYYMIYPERLQALKNHIERNTKPKSGWQKKLEELQSKQKQ